MQAIAITLVKCSLKSMITCSSYASSTQQDITPSGNDTNLHAALVLFSVQELACMFRHTPAAPISTDIYSAPTATVWNTDCARRCFELNGRYFLVPWIPTTRHTGDSTDPAQRRSREGVGRTQHIDRCLNI